MKQVFFILTVIVLGVCPATAQLGAGTMASSLLTKPVLLADVNLKASFVNNAASISWQATQQAKVRRYELEKSMDGENFSYITSFAGTERSYTTKDNDLFTSTTYYRLKIVDADGNFLYSMVETINAGESANAIRILPGTADDGKLRIWVPANTSISCAMVSGADGKMQRKAVMNQSTNLAAVDISGMAAGVYNLSVQTNKGETLKLKFTKS